MPEVAVANGATMSLTDGDDTINVPFTPAGTPLKASGNEVVAFGKHMLGGVAIASCSMLAAGLKVEGSPVMLVGATVMRVDGYQGTIPPALSAGPGIQAA